MFASLLIAVALALMPAAAAIAAGDVRIYVSPQGNDSWTGSAASASGTDGPVRSLARAQALARAQSAQARAPIRVTIAPGTYYLGAPLVFTPADSGTAEAPVSYEAATAGTVTLSGGVPLVQRSAARPGVPAAFDLPPAARDTWRGGGQLFVGGQWATLARQPKAGQYWFVQRAVTLDSEPSAETGRGAFVPSAEASTWLGRLPPAERSRAIVQLMHSWNSSQHRIADTAGPGGAIRLNPRARWAFLSTGSSQRFFVENVPSALTAGGEWVATESEVRYLPTEAQMGKPIEAVLPVLEKLIVIQGDAGKPVQYLAFRGLGFAHTRYLTPEAGFIDSQAAVDVGAAFEADAARNITIDHCSFTNVAGYGVWLRRSVRDSRVSNSQFSQLGGGGVQVGVTKENPGERAPSASNTIDGNQIGGTGALFPGAVGVWLGQGFDNTVANNLIHDTSYTGISVGWNWSFNPSASGRHRITDNLLVNIGQAKMSDMGGIYTLGVLTGTVISGNVIRDVRAYPGYGPGGRALGAWGIYNDLGSSDLVVENNVVLGTDGGGYHLNGGRQLTVRQNVFAGGTKAEVLLSRTSGKTPQATLEGNVFVPKSNKPFDGLAGSPELAFTGNLVSAALAAAPPDLSPCGAGCSASKATVTASAEPKAIKFDGFDTASAARLARVVAQAGPTDGAVVASARVAVATRAPVAAVAPPQPVSIDLRGAAVGSQPAGLTYMPAGDKQAIHLVENASAPGGRCLQFNDSPAMAKPWDPHAFASLTHEAGTDVAEFSILIDANTNFLHEWRDNDRVFHTGPSLRITAAGVAVGGKVVAPASVGQWMRIRVTSPLGTPGARWQLEVRDGSGKVSTVPNLPPVSPAWRDLNWIGFISNATVTSSLCVAEISVTSSAGR